MARDQASVVADNGAIISDAAVDAAKVAKVKEKKQSKWHFDRKMILRNLFTERKVDSPRAEQRTETIKATNEQYKHKLTCKAFYQNNLVNSNWESQFEFNF